MNQAFKQVAGAKTLFSSKQVPGLIYGPLVGADGSLAKRRADWVKVVAVWSKVLAFISDPKTHDTAIAIMVKRNGVDPKERATIFPGPRLQTLAENQAAFVAGPKGPGTLLGAQMVGDDFNRAQKIYADALTLPPLIDGSLVNDALAAAK